MGASVKRERIVGLVAQYHLVREEHLNLKALMLKKLYSSRALALLNLKELKVKKLSISTQEHLLHI